MRWAEIVANGSLDDSRDGLNLMMKTTLQVVPTETVKEEEEAKPSKPTKVKGISWKDALLGSSIAEARDERVDVMETVAVPMLDSTASNGFSSRKRLAQEMDKDKTSSAGEVDKEDEEAKAKEKRRKKNDAAPNVDIKKALESVKSPIYQVRRIRSWASDSEESDDEDVNPIRQETRSEHFGSPEQLNVSIVSNTPGYHEMAPLTAQRISKRQKQIDIGKATDGYKNYIKQVPPKDRVAGNSRHPVTPSTEKEISKRAWDVVVRSWRRKLHLYDDPSTLKQNKHIRLKTPRRKRKPRKNAAQSAPPKTKLPAEIEIKLEEFPEL